MIRKKTTPLWSVMLIVMVFLLTACVRPVPTEPTNTPMPTSEIAIEPNTPESVAPPEIPPTDTPDPNLPTATPEPTAIPENATQIYTVQAGDSLGVIAQQYSTTVSAIQQANGLGNSTLIHPGDELIIPGADFKPTDTPVATPISTPENGNAGSGGNEQQGKGQVHIVQPGENLFRIGYNNGCSTQQMANYNRIANPWYIYPGQELRIPPDC